MLSNFERYLTIAGASCRHYKEVHVPLYEASVEAFKTFGRESNEFQKAKESRIKSGEQQAIYHKALEILLRKDDVRAQLEKNDE